MSSSELDCNIILKKIDEKLARVVSMLESPRYRFSEGDSVAKRKRHPFLESDTESDSEPGQADLWQEHKRHKSGLGGVVERSDDEAEEDNAGVAIVVCPATKAPLVFVEELEGTRFYRQLVRATTRTMRVARFSYDPDAPLVAEPEGSLECEESKDGTFFVPPLSMRFEVAAVVGVHDFSLLRDLFLSTPPTERRSERKQLLLDGVSKLFTGKNTMFDFGALSNAAASDELRHMLTLGDAAALEPVERLDEPRTGFLCDACNTRRLITHQWDRLNLGSTCARRIHRARDVLLLCDYGTRQLRDQGHSLFVRFMVAIHKLFTCNADDKLFLDNSFN